VARLGRRVLAICLDWAIASVIGYSFMSGPKASLVVLGIFAIAQILFIPTLGGSVGHAICGMRVVPIAGGWVGVWRPVVRTVLLCLVIPVVVWDSDQRGFHDKIAGTVLLKVRG
jgi:uncharacterized RDD family membrane protein YckC